MTERKHAPEATDAPTKAPAVGSQVDLVLGPLFEKALVDFGVACRFGDTAARQGTAERIRAAARALLAAERERMIADGWRQTRYVAPVTDCEACLTPDACAIRGQCGHYLRERG
jgi:hypothetical protein